MTVKIIVQPSEEPVTLAQAKDQCAVDGTEFDVLLGLYIAAARKRAEHETGRALCTQTRELVLDAFPAACILRGAPTQSLTSVKYLDSTGAEQTLDLQNVILDKDSEPGRVVLGYGKSWPATYPVPNAVRVRYVCGYGAADAVPDDIKAWMLLAISTLFDNRSTVADGNAVALPDRFWQAFLDPHRLYEA